MNKNYRSAGDFFSDESFQRYVLHSTPEDTAYWEAWLQRHPDRAEEAGQAVMMIQSLHLPEKDLPAGEYAAEETRFEAFLANHPARPASRPVQAPARRYRYAAVVAGLLILLAGAGRWWQQRPGDWVTYQTGAGEKSQIELPDQSVVHLNARSSVRVSRVWTGDQPREVWLEGEAYFDVKHRPAHGSAKFTVHTPAVDVQVLGTQFNVLEHNGQTQVVLSTGKIELALKNDNHRLLMKPGDLVRVSARDASVSQRLVNPEVYTAWKDSRFVFDNTPVAEIAALLQNRYGLTVAFADTALMHRRFTFRMPDNDLELLLKTMSKSLDLTITREQNRILIGSEPVSEP